MLSFMLPAWADVLIVLALPLILGAVLYFWGEEHPDNAAVHHQQDTPRDDEDGAGFVKGFGRSVLRDWRQWRAGR